MNIIKNEFKRIVLSKEMLLSLVVGCLIVIWHQIIYVWNPGHALDNERCMESVYYNWIGGNCGHFQSFLFYFVFPILAVFPTGATYLEDRNSGYINHYTVRNAHKEYMTGKILGTFFSGAIAVFIPLILSFILTALKFPLLNPEPVMGLGPDVFSFDCEMYYENPLLHSILFILFDSVFSGGIALFAITSCFLFEHRFAVLVTPFVIHYFLFSIDRIWGSNNLSPNYFLIPGFAPHLWWEFAISIIVFSLNICFIYIMGRKERKQ